MKNSRVTAGSALSVGAIILFAGILNTVAAQVKTAAKAAGDLRAVTVVTEAGASVWMDGVLFGKTGKDGTLTIKTVAPGSHVLLIRADGFKEKSQTVTGAQKGEIKAALVKTTDEAELAFQEAGRLSLVDRDRAADAYRKAVKLRPSYAEAYLALGRLLSDAGDLDAARKALAAAKKLRPGYAEASAVEGRILKDGGDEEKAITAFKRAIAEGKGFQPEALTGLGLLYKERAEGFGGSGDFDREKVNYDESAKYLKKALIQLSGAPDSLVVYQLLGLIYEREHRFSDAIALYEEFLRLFPDSSEASAVRSFIVQIKNQMKTPQ